MLTKSLLKTWFGASATEQDFEEFYQAELPRVYNYFRYRVGDGQLAEDLTSETFEKVWRSRYRYKRDLGAFSTWLYTIAHRVAIDHYRKHRDNLSIDEIPHLADEGTMEDLAEQRAEFAHLLSLLARLDDRDRELVTLKYGAGLTNRKIASITGLSESNVGVIIHRAVKTLRKEWEGLP